MRRIAAWAIGCALICPSLGLAEPFTVDHLLAQEQVEPGQIDPSGRWLVVQRYERWDSAPLFDLDDFTRYGVGRVQVFDLKAGGVERRLDLPPGAGYVALSVSPGGRRMAIGRLVGHAWELGVADLESGQVRWLGLSPRHEVFGPTLAWRTDEDLLVIARAPDAPDHHFGFGFLAQERLPRLWAQAARGQTAVTVVGSGRYLDLRPKPPNDTLVAVDLARGEQRALATGEFVDLALAPGGKAAALVALGADIQPSGDGPTTSGSPPRQRWLVLIDLTTEKVSRPLPDLDLMGRMLSWSGDGRALLVFARPPGQPWSSGCFWRASVERPASALDLHGLIPAFADTPDHDVVPRAGWLDGAPVVYARKAADGRADYWRIAASHPVNLTAALPAPGRVIGWDRQVWAIASGNALWRVTASGTADWGVPTSAVRSLAETPPGDRPSYDFKPHLNQLLLSAGSTASTWPGQTAPSLPADQRLTSMSAAATVDLSTDAHGVQTVGLRLAGQERRALVSTNAVLKAVDFVQPVAIAHKGVDGEDLVSWLYLPPPSAPRTRGRPPLVVIPYPGESFRAPPASQAAPAFRFMTNAQLIAGAGYAVLVPALPIRPGREPMDGLTDQILAAVDAAGAEAQIDTDRLAVFGHSFGGYTAIAAAVQSARFKAVISGAATTNLMSAYGHVGPTASVVPEVGLPIAASTGWQETGQARMGVPPWKDPQRYLRNSPIVFADRIRAPVLILYGDNDKELAQPQALFGALYRQNKDAVFVTYRGEGHVITSPGNVRDEYARILAFLAEHIGPP